MYYKIILCRYPAGKAGAFSISKGFS